MEGGRPSRDNENGGRCAVNAALGDGGNGVPPSTGENRPISRDIGGSGLLLCEVSEDVLRYEARAVPTVWIYLFHPFHGRA
jgi:hypothetical protein